MALLGRSPPEDGKRLYLNEGLVFAIFGMEMCGTVVAEVHSNHNPKESSYLRHFLFPFYPLRTRRVRSRIFWLVLGMPPRRKKINEAIKRLTRMSNSMFTFDSAIQNQQVRQNWADADDVTKLLGLRQWGKCVPSVGGGGDQSTLESAGNPGQTERNRHPATDYSWLSPGHVNYRKRPARRSAVFTGRCMGSASSTIHGSLAPCISCAGASAGRGAMPWQSRLPFPLPVWFRRATHS